MIKTIHIILAFLRGYTRAKLGRFLSKHQIVKRQATLFMNLKKTVLCRSPFYQSWLLRDLKDYPIINKSIHTQHFNEINTAQLDRDKALEIAIKSEQSRDFSPTYKNYAVGLSSGTSGSRGLFVTSNKERAEWAGYMIGKMLPFKFKRQKVALFLRANNRLYESSKGILLDFKFFDLIQPMKTLIAAVNQYSPDILIAPAQVLQSLSQVESLTIQPSKIISVAEVLEEPVKKQLEAAFKVKIDEIYQCTEGFLAATCSHGNLHLNEDVVYIEKDWLDSSSGRFAPIITDLRRSTQPVVRYRLDDILIIDEKPCQCGSSFTRIKSIEGRCDDILLLKNANDELISIYPDFIRNTLLMSHKQIENYQVIQTANDMLNIFLQPLNEEIQQAVVAHLTILWQHIAVIPPNYQFADYQAPPLNEKLRRISRHCNEKKVFS